MPSLLAISYPDPNRAKLAMGLVVWKVRTDEPG
jgi:hypothetical protein